MHHGAWGNFPHKHENPATELNILSAAAVQSYMLLAGRKTSPIHWLADGSGHCTRRTMKSLLTLLTLTCLTVSAEARTSSADNSQDDKPSNPQDQRDPTVPSAEIQRLTQPEPEAPKPESEARTRAATPPTRPVSRPAAQPVKLAPMSLQSLVRSSDKKCTATIRSGKELVTVSFTRGETKRQIELPKTQFVGFASTIQRLADELAQLRTRIVKSQTVEASVTDSASTLAESQGGSVDRVVKPVNNELANQLLEEERAILRKAMRPQVIDLSSSFTLDGDLYRVVDFTANTLLVEQIPLGKYIIVR